MTKELQISYYVGTEKVVLSSEVVRNYLVSGGGEVSNQELVFYMKLCKARGLNPWVKDCYLIKYGKDDAAATIISKDFFLKRAQRNEKYLGHEVLVSDDGKAATCNVYVKDYKVPISVTVEYGEYVGRKKDGTVNKQWQGKPKTMLRKCALVAGLREAFSEDLGNLYIKEEIRKSDTVSNEMEMPSEVEEAPDIDASKKGRKPFRKKQAHEDKGWQQVCESFRETLGEDAFNKVLNGFGFSSVSEIPDDMHEDLFEAWSRETASCL